MDNTANITRSFVSGSETLRAKEVVTDDNLLEISSSVTGGTSHTFAAPLTAANLKLAWMQTDVDGCTFTLSGASNPAPVIDADAPFCWTDGCHLANPIVSNVTTIIVAVPAGPDAQIDMRFLSH